MLLPYKRDVCETCDMLCIEVDFLVMLLLLLYVLGEDLTRHRV